MSISLYSVLTSFLWFNLFVLILCFLRWKLGIVLGYSLLPLIMLFVLSTVRLLLPFEPSFVVVLRSERILPFIQDVLQTKLFTSGTTDITLAMGGVLIFSLISVVLLARLLLLLHRKQKRINAYVQTDDARLLSIFAQVQEEAPSKGKCYLYVLEHCSSPCILGITHSVILLPKKILSLSDQDLYYILKHEWFHHLEKDVFVKLFIEGLSCVMWWNPLMLLLKHNLNQTLELKCDKKVTKNLNLEQRLNYTEALLDVLTLCGEIKPRPSREEFVSIPFLGMAANYKASAHANTIQRFDAILESDHRSGKIGLACGTCLMLLFFASFCFVIQPYSFPSDGDLMPDMKGETDIDLLQVTPETSVLVDNEDGTYSLFVNGEYWHDITEQAIAHKPF